MTNFMSTTSIETTEPVLIRHATAGDTRRIRELARLDDRRMPTGRFLVAELGDEIVAAKSLSTGAVVADPFRRTADAVAMLDLRAAQLGAVSERGAARPAHREHRLAVAA
jgi:antirestriction protein ArdC